MPNIFNKIVYLLLFKSDIKDHNLSATGLSRKDWILYEIAEEVWGHRPAAEREVVDTNDVS